MIKNFIKFIFKMRYRHFKLNEIIFIVKLQDVKSPEDYSVMHKCIVIAMVLVGCITISQLVTSFVTIIRNT